MDLAVTYCPCLAGFLKLNKSSTPDDDARAKYAFMIRGGRFLKKQYLGLTSVEILLTLDDDLSLLKYATVSNSSWGSEERGAIDINKIVSVSAVYEQGISISHGLGEEQETLQIIAETSCARDKWKDSMTELIHNESMNPMPMNQSKITASDTSDKAKYFASRLKDVEDRERTRDEKRKKYASGGMKYTAIAMANRQDK